MDHFYTDSQYCKCFKNLIKMNARMKIITTKSEAVAAIEAQPSTSSKIKVNPGLLKQVQEQLSKFSLLHL